MQREIPHKLIHFFKNAFKDMDDGYEYCSELNRILNSDECQASLTPREIDMLREFAETVKRNVGEFNYYSEQRIKEYEKEFFGNDGVLGYLGVETKAKPIWPF